MNTNEEMSIEKCDLSTFFRKCHDLKVPYFQREYSWDNKQIRQLIDDIIDSKVETYYIGTIVLSRKNNYLYIIDGQQRISTFILILNQLIYHHSFIDENNFKDKEYFKKLLEENFSFESMNLKDSKYLDEIIHSNGEDYSKNRYQENNKCIEIKIKELYKKNLINKFIKNLTNMIFCLVITNSPKIDENVLFEKINSTGKQLSQYDLSKNYLLSKIWKEYEGHNKNLYIEKCNNRLHEITKFLDLDNANEKKSKKGTISKKTKSKYNKDDLIRYFIAYKTKILVSNEEIYEEFKKLVHSFYDNDGLKVLEDFQKFTLYYQYVFERKWKNEIFENQMILIEKFFNTFIILVIRIFEINSFIENNQIIINEADKQEINKLLLVLECYIYRRNCVNLSEKIITRKMPAIIFDKDKHNNLEEYLFYKLYSNNEVLAYRMPSFNEFYKSVYDQNADLYSASKRKTTKLFLYRLGMFNCKEKIDSENLSIEHIIPQAYQDIIEYASIENVQEKINVLGNLTLTVGENNSKMSNKSFFDKKNILISHDNIPLNKYFHNVFKWDIQAIDERTKYLLNLTKQIWNYDHYENKNVNIINNNTNEEIKKISEFDLKENNKKLKSKYNNEKYQKALKSISSFRKIDKNLFSYENVKSIIESYLLDNAGFEDIENNYFNKNFDGWVGQSIVEILEIKRKDKNEVVLLKDIDYYILSIEDNIREFLEFINDIKFN